MRALSALGNGLLTLLSVLGVVCIAAVIASQFFQISLIMFSTGSMSPTIPTGSVALVREIPASEIRVGDVVTVSRADALPITHRVTSVATPGGAPEGDARTITMRGDANPQDDREPYVVDTVRIVMGSVPGAARVIVAASHPLVMGTVTVTAALLVTWAFWPRGERGGRRRSEREAQPDAAVTGDVPAFEPLALPVQPGDTGRSARTRGGAGPLLAALLFGAVASTAGQASPAQATGAETDTVIRGQYLTLTSVASPGFDALTAGVRAYWQVGITADAPEPGLIDISISAAGSLAESGGILVDLRSCPVRWVDGICPDGQELWSDWGELAAVAGDGRTTFLASRTAEETVWVMVGVMLPEGTAPGASTDIQIHADAVGDAVGGAGGAPDPGTGATAGATAGSLANTGISPLWWMPVSAILAGLTLAGLARLRPRVLRSAGVRGSG